MKTTFGILGGFSGLYFGCYLREETTLRKTILIAYKTLNNGRKSDFIEKNEYKDIAMAEQMWDLTNKYKVDDKNYDRIGPSIDNMRPIQLNREYKDLKKIEKKDSPYKETLRNKNFKQRREHDN